MASEITSDGRMIAPLNISAPAPILTLRGFKWDTGRKNPWHTAPRRSSAAKSDIPCTGTGTAAATSGAVGGICQTARET
jgi:hypothetical protein